MCKGGCVTTNDVQNFYKGMLKGSARKHSSKKLKKFTAEQKKIMELCFNKGEHDKRK
jgi:hypothetical protein